jgi:hypothetical protein
MGGPRRDCNLSRPANGNPARRTVLHPVRLAGAGPPGWSTLVAKSALPKSFPCDVTELELVYVALARLADAYGGPRSADQVEELLREAEHRQAAESQSVTDTTADPVTLANAVVIDFHRRDKKLTVTQLVKQTGIRRTALYDNIEFATLRNLAHELFPNMFGKKAKKGDWRGPRGTKDKAGNLDAEDVDAEPIEDKAVD